MGAPFRYDDVARWLQRAAPTLGQHSREILGELGWDDAGIAALEADGVIGVRPRSAPEPEALDARSEPT
jgi:crotonobetainyl-CoA:carnitine CoA-transferase CaiB-like acyl-CoA transferase